MSSLPAIRFDQLEGWCRAQGLHSLATMVLPEHLDDRGLQQTLRDGVGDMQWLIEQADLRRQPRQLLPESQWALITSLPYQAHTGDDQADSLRCARYALGKDYHHLYRRKLAQVGRAISAACPGSASRACVDSAPINERQLAEMAGIGWIGRNALIIDPQRGSYHFLGCLLSTAPLELRHANKSADRCGRCTACHQACPTQALVGRRVISERCISYLTIEHHGVIPRHLAERFDGWWYGCDRCQEVCPWNRFAGEAGDPRLTGQGDGQALQALTADQFDVYFAGRPQRRLGWSRFRRNLLVALFSRQRFTEAQALLNAGGDQLLIAQAHELGLGADSSAP